MFFKYLMENIKCQKLQFITLILCEAAMLILAIIANAIMNDNIATKSDIRYYAKYYQYPIHRTRISELRDVIYQFAEECPVDFEFSMRTTCYSTEVTVGGDPYTDTTVCYFPSYSQMKKHFDFLSDSELPSEQLYNSDEKFALVGKGVGVYSYNDHGEIEYADANHVIFGGEKFLAIENSKQAGSTLLLRQVPENITTAGVSFELLDYQTEQQDEEIREIFERIFADYIDEDGYVKPTSPTDLLEVRKASSSIVLTAFAQIISAFNVMLIFKFIIDSRKKQFAVLRLCGFKKSVCLRYSLSELLIVSGISAALACVLIQVLKPTLKTHLSVFVVLYDWGYLLLLALAFLAATVLVFVIYIVPSLGKSVSHELREM